ncbi:Sh2d1b2 [Phodopus roborovskii]|uniref:Sh2d1b2 protein n=1 Tax=Phodopus roborovskii TaxID=109678 RepID=A0AAU9ZBQ3_PHORO|nr:Sh2d1b2 [Phodopus roborovskii]
MDLPYYHGQLTKQECETLLLKAGVDGNYLIRDSESMPGVLCLCTVEGAPKQIFPNLEELVSNYEKPGQGLVVHLSNPIMRNSFYQRGRRMKLELNVYDACENQDELLRVVLLLS